jgi:hypothetical protein
MVDALLAAFILAPLVLAFFLRSNGAVSFLALCAGFVLTTYVGSDFKNLLNHFGFNSLNLSTLNLILLILPLALTLLLTRHTFEKRSSFLIHGLPVLSAGGLLAVAAIPFLSGSLQDSFNKSHIWFDLQKAQAAYIGIGVLISLLIIWFEGLKHHPKKHK